MRLFTKIAITMAVTVVAGTIASAAAVAVVFVPQYLEMDRAAALTNAQRVYEFLQHELETSTSYAGDWGHWDETFEFAATRDKGYIKRNLKQEDLETIHVDEFVIARFDRSVVFEHRANQEAGAPAVPFAGAKSVPAAHWREFSNKLSRETHAGYAATPAGPAIVATTAITDSNGNGPSPGVMIFVRLVDDEFLKSVREKTDLDFTLTPATAAPAKGEAGFIGKARDVPVVLFKRDGRTDVSVALKDVSGTPSFTLRVATPARFAEMAVTTMWVTLGVLFAIGCVIGLVLFAFMQRVVTRPLEAVIAHTEAIAATGNLDNALNLSRSDEIGALAKAFDHMIGDLRQARLQLQEQSYVSGMANLAAEMLHNIRNSLSPVATAIWKGRESLKDVHAERLAQAGVALGQAEVDTEKKAKLAEYVSASAQHISERCRNAEAEFETIRGFTHQIELVLKHHEELSRGVRHVERVDVAEIVSAAAKLAVLPHSRHIDLVIGEGVARLPAVAAQRVVLLQVLGNLVVNAVRSIERAGASPGRIVFDGRDLDGRVELTVTDNGEGIAAEHMASLFQRGFTSRPGEGTGLGLHYCATSLGAMNGSIKAQSSGPGTGATLRIVLPVAESKDKAA